MRGGRWCLTVACHKYDMCRTCIHTNDVDVYIRTRSRLCPPAVSYSFRAEKQRWMSPVSPSSLLCLRGYCSPELDVLVCLHSQRLIRAMNLGFLCSAPVPSQEPSMFTKARSLGWGSVCPRPSTPLRGRDPAFLSLNPGFFIFEMEMPGPDEADPRPRRRPAE